MTNIWYIHPYAGGPGIGRYDRPFHLANSWKKKNYNPVIICPSYHHLLDQEQLPGMLMVEGAAYEFLASSKYKGNGLGRMKHMLLFGFKLLKQYKELSKRHGKPQVIIASSPHPYIVLAAYSLAVRTKARFIFEVRDLWPLSLVELAGLNKYHPLVLFTALFERGAYRKADSVVSLLPETRDFMCSRGLKPENWCYIPNGVLTDFGAEEVSSPCLDFAEDKIRQGCKVVVYAGALGIPNNLELLLNAIEDFKHQGGDGLHFILIGRGERKQAIEKKIHDCGLSAEVTLFDQVPKAVVQRLLSIVSFGFISLKPENIFKYGVSPNKLFDYMLAKLPVIYAINSGNTPVSDCGCGISCDPSDYQSVSRALKQASELSSDELVEMGQAGYDYAMQNHNYEALASAYEKLFR